MPLTVSVLVCTRNHLASLQATIRSLAALRIPKSCEVELLVIDNGSSDGTAAWVRQAQLPNMPVRLVEELQAGQARARNRGLEAARGAIILFTDDDVRVPPNWLTAHAHHHP